MVLPFRLAGFLSQDALGSLKEIRAAFVEPATSTRFPVWAAATKSKSHRKLVGLGSALSQYSKSPTDLLFDQAIQNCRSTPPNAKVSRAKTRTSPERKSKSLGRPCRSAERRAGDRSVSQCTLRRP